MLKKILIHTKKSIKLVIIISIALLFIIGLISFFYKVSYSVKINDSIVGYTDNKSKLQMKINEYIEKGENENTAYVQVENLPEYNVCFLKRNVNSDDDKIYELIREQGVTYYRYYAILDNQEEKFYVSKFSDAEEVIEKLKQKDSGNANLLTISEKYENELKTLSSIDDVVSGLYVEKKTPVVVAKKSGINFSTTISSAKSSIGISLIKPVSGILSSRFGVRSSIRSSAHTGLDIATSTGTPVVAAASGTVSYSGWKGSYGNLLIINHSNGVQTYYGHCSKLYASVGQSVSQGQTVCAVGSTGNSTGPHLHFEVRLNGVAYNPQNYVY